MIDAYFIINEDGEIIDYGFGKICELPNIGETIETTYFKPTLKSYEFKVLNIKRKYVNSLSEIDYIEIELESLN